MFLDKDPKVKNANVSLRAKGNTKCLLLFLNKFTTVW